MQRQSPFILCVDDDADDLTMLREAFEAAGCSYGIEVASDGEAALKHLKVLREKADFPSLIILDVNMPKSNGRETLLALQADDQFSKIPVVAFSTSSSALDKMFFSKHNVAFFTKPNYYKEMETIAATMLDYCRKSDVAA